MTVTFELMVTLLGLYVLWTWVYRTYRVDKTRASLFSQRHRLYMLAANGHISYEAPAYRDTERLLNALIRHTHQMTLIRLLVMRPFMGPVGRGDDAGSVYQTVADHGNPEVREKLQDILGKAGFISLSQLAMSFLPTWLLLQAAIKIKICRRWLKRSAPTRFASQIRLLEDEALAS